MSFLMSILGSVFFGLASLFAFTWDTPHEYLAMFFFGMTVTFVLNTLFHIEKETVGLAPFIQ